MSLYAKKIFRYDDQRTERWNERVRKREIEREEKKREMSFFRGQTR